MSALIPTTDLSEFLQLPDAVRAEIELWNNTLAEVSRPYEQALKTVAAKMGCSFQTARRKFHAWRKMGGPAGSGWRALINRAKAPEARGLPDDFIEYWKKLCEQNGRKCKPAYREFVRQYRAGLPIPGLDASGAANVPRGSMMGGRTALPHGYTYCNLVRYKPTKFELTAARIGRNAAADFRPKIFTTRVGLSVGQRIIFDDMWHDFKVAMWGTRRPGRLLQLHAHDLFSGCQFARGLKPRLEDPDTGKSTGLNESEMTFLVAHVLAQYGFHPDGTVLMVEHGTAAINDTLEQLIYDLTVGKVTVERSGIDGSQLSSFAGQYCGQRKGNFRFKAALESLGNLIHNETANLLAFPGQTGSNSRLNLPEEMAGREKHMDTLALAIVGLCQSNPQLATQLRLPFLEVNQAKWLVEQVMERINNRTDHELEGWLEAGLTTIDFDVPGIGLIQSQKFLALPADRQAAITAIANPAPRRLSPREVFDSGRRRLVKLRPEQTATLLLKAGVALKCGESDDGTVTVGDDHLIQFDDKSISPTTLRYTAHHFAPGDKFQAVLNPMSPDTLFLFDARGAWAGQVQLWQSIPHTDPEALREQMGRAARIEKQLLAPLAARGSELTKQRLADTQHNINAIRGDQRKQDTLAAKAKAALLSATDSF